MGDKDLTNERLRLLGIKEFQNKESDVEEVDIDPARNANEFSIISYWEYTTEAGFWCKHSFIAPNRLSLLIEGHKGEIFFFNEYVDSSS